MQKTLLICLLLLPALILAERSLADIANDEAETLHRSADRLDKMTNYLAAIRAKQTETEVTIKFLTELQKNSSSVFEDLKNVMANRRRLMDDIGKNDSEHVKFNCGESISMSVLLVCTLGILGYIAELNYKYNKLLKKVKNQ